MAVNYSLLYDQTDIDTTFSILMRNCTIQDKSYSKGIYFYLYPVDDLVNSSNSKIISRKYKDLDLLYYDNKYTVLIYV